ncbi:unnamed protein product [Closterium sp. Naga37s-1]|nr:unnamed protein product [Closterium sp. Naga37s-1]
MRRRCCDVAAMRSRGGEGDVAPPGIITFCLSSATSFPSSPPHPSSSPSAPLPRSPPPARTPPLLQARAGLGRPPAEPREACGKRRGRMVWRGSTPWPERSLSLSAPLALLGIAGSVGASRATEARGGGRGEVETGGGVGGLGGGEGAQIQAPLLSSRSFLAPSTPTPAALAASRCPSPSPRSAATEVAAGATICAERLAEKEARGSDTSTPTK